MKPRFTIAELKTMDANRGKRLEEMKAEIEAAKAERRETRAKMETATAALDSKTYSAAAEKEEQLTKKIGRLMDAVKALDTSKHSFTDDDVKRAWAEDMKGYNAEIAKAISAYREAKRALFENYVSLALAQDKMFSRMYECEKMLKDKPARLYDLLSPLREAVKAYIPAFTEEDYCFFRDVMTPEDPSRFKLAECGNGHFARLEAAQKIDRNAEILAGYNAGMVNFYGSAMRG